MILLFLKAKHLSSQFGLATLTEERLHGMSIGVGHVATGERMSLKAKITILLCSDTQNCMHAQRSSERV